MQLIIIICATTIVILSLFIWFLIPYSPLKREFKKECQLLSQKVEFHGEIFSKKLLSTKPELLKRYIEFCGLYNRPMMKSSFTKHIDADFLLKDNKPMAKIQYTHINFATTCERAALIDAKIGKFLPFQGLDDNLKGKGRMKGVIAKLFTAFDVQGDKMDASALVTVLSEGIICPSFLMHDDIVWTEVDSNHLQAKLTQYRMTVSGVFEFDNNGAIVGFYSKDRYKENNGTMTQRDWKVECENYKEINGLKYPTVFRAFWLYPKYEKIYFNCNNVVISYHY